MNWIDFVYGILAGIAIMIGASMLAVHIAMSSPKAARSIVHMFMNMKK
jgi:hypothetical protein